METLYWKQYKDSLLLAERTVCLAATLLFLDTTLQVVLCVCVYVCVLAAQSCPTLCNPMDCSPPGSSVRGILQARILEWAAMPSSRGPSHTGMEQGLLHCRQILYCLSTREAPPLQVDDAQLWGPPFSFSIFLGTSLRMGRLPLRGKRRRLTGARGGSQVMCVHFPVVPFTGSVTQDRSLSPSEPWGYLLVKTRYDQHLFHQTRITRDNNCKMLGKMPGTYTINVSNYYY